MSPEYMDKLAIAMQIVSNETHFRQMLVAGLCRVSG